MEQLFDGTDPVGVTSAVGSGEWVVGLGVDPTVVDDELEGVLHLSAVAPTGR